MSYTFVSDISILVAVVITIISFFVGVLGGLVGLALGTIRLPAMLLLGIDPRIAAGTNIITSSVSTFFGAVKHIREKNINKRIILFMGIPATAGTFIGGLLSPHVPIDLLLISAGILVLWQGIEFIILGLSKKQKMSDALGTNIDNTKGKFNKTSIAIESSLGLSIGTLGGAVGLILGSIRLPAIIRILKIVFYSPRSNGRLHSPVVCRKLSAVNPRGSGLEIGKVEKAPIKQKASLIKPDNPGRPNPAKNVNAIKAV